MKEKTILDRMVDRFLSWQLPKDFSPDGGISFDGAPDMRGYGRTRPTGTNLLTAEQAKEMIRHILDVG